MTASRDMTSTTMEVAAVSPGEAGVSSTATPASRVVDTSAGFVTNILIVDDEPSNLLALEAILEPLGQNLVRAGSGIEALKHALKMDFCVVLLDVQMPEMDGLEAAELLRKRPRTRDVPIIFLTAISKDKEHVSRGYDVGAVDYLFKPYDPDALRTKVATFVDLAQKNARIRAQHEALRVGSARELADFKRWSERRYEDLADAMPQIVWTADTNGNLTYHNRRWEELAAPSRRPGLAENEAAESRPRYALDHIVHPDDMRSFSSGWAEAIRAGTEWESELLIGSSQHGYRYHLVRAVPRYDDQKKIVGWVGTATDIDERVRADRALRMLAEASHRLTRSFEEPRELEAVLHCALPVLGDGAILDVQASETNGAVGERVHVVRHGFDPAVLRDPRLDLGPATVVYTGRAEVFYDVQRESQSSIQSESSPNPSGRGAEHLRFLAELGVSAYICVPLMTQNRAIGTLTFVRLTKGDRFTSVDVDLAGDLARRVAVSIDNARLHATSEKRREELELANRSKDVFLATLSHELRTPLNAIVGWTDMMKKGALQGPELDRAMETIDRNAHALSGLVGDLLDVSRIVTGTLKIESKRVSVAAVVEAAVLGARPQCTSKGINLELALAEDEANRTADVVGDSGRLRQVITNLLSNAIKFTPKGGTVRVVVSVDEAEKRVRVEVKDSGEGIDPDFLPHVFERFRQQETGRAKGLGLGLAIVKHLVEEHGGAVSADSAGLGKGATLIVELPLASSEQSASRETDIADGGPPSTPPTTNGDPDLKGAHVLIVEDDPDGNELICTILERYGARVTSTMNAADALQALEDEHPEVLVSDIGLPDQDGMTLIKTVRSKPAFKNLPAVALTAYASRQDATKAISAGFDAHVAKPVQPATLGGVVARLLASAKLKDAQPDDNPGGKDHAA